MVSVSYRFDFRTEINAQTNTILTILYLLDRHSSMNFEELLETGFFEKRHLRNSLRRLIQAGCILAKLEIYYITENGVKFLSCFPNWKLKEGIITPLNMAGRKRLNKQ